ncbi:uncharacterized protein (TIGR00369 family) [Natronocella acetinitrilica]|uniref:Medium/long-chain acyl-CoA thioesterase YigI n=1 Tax=Natronocella acetinitrilica TaxID=414046 RepID=A0AAE3KBD9_9GAMM|nr:PaaI family thioesterase [Natronocella acetinitrilica]MCP1674689.1 uncharacterized protein (TIGR00369 family) [Natronocella acetinitrilica]
MQARNPQFRERVIEIIERADFIQLLGMEFTDAGAGWCETRMPLANRHRQQDGFVHAGVQATMADHTAGCAAFTLIDAAHHVLTIEFKINLLRPALGEALICRGEVLRGGRRVIVAESAVSARAADGSETLCAKATVTLAVVNPAEAGS